jgi:SPP1 gp7 family putative phage head morphogenesis protein
MKIGNFDISLKKYQAPVDVSTPRDMSKEISYADSSYYEKYQLKPYNPSDLYQQQGSYRLYDKIREDDQVGSLLMLKKIIILNSDWIIETENQDVQEFLGDCLNKYLDDVFIKKLYEILSALDYGFSLSEKVWDRIDTKEYGQKIVLSKLKTRAPHTFELHTDQYGNISKILQHTGKMGDIELDPNKFILYTYNKEFDNPYGNSDINKGIYRAWWSKDAIIKFWNIYLERFGMPLTVGTMPEKAGLEERNQLLNVLNNMQAKTAIVIPNDVLIDLKSVASGGSAEYEKAIDKYNLMISRKFLLPDLLGFSGAQISGGSYALGEQQFNIFYNTVEYIRMDLCRLINRDIINPLVEWNYGKNEYAEFKFKPIDKERQKNNMLLWLDAVKSGKIPITNEHINWFLNRVEAPEIDQKTLDEMDAEKEALKEKLNGGQQEHNSEEESGSDKDLSETGKSENKHDVENDSADKTDDEVDMDDTEDDEDVKKSKRNSGKEFVKFEPYREYTKYEKRVNFQRIFNGTEDISLNYKNKIADAITLCINGLISDIRSKKIIEKRALSQVNKLTFRNYGRVQKLFRDMLKDSYQLAIETIEQPKEYNIKTPTGLNNDDVLEWLSENAFYVSDIEQIEILKRVKGILMDSIRAGNGVRDIVNQISASLSDYDINLGASRIETIVRTNVSKAFNETRALQYKELSEHIKAYQYSAIMDGRTSDICIALDGKIFPASELDYFNPPNHFNCRSLVLPIFNYDEEAELTPETEMPATIQEKGDFLKLKK